LVIRVLQFPLFRFASAELLVQGISGRVGRAGTSE
jgi:hypothetical protein